MCTGWFSHGSIKSVISTRKDLPRTDYEIRFETRRIEGFDFFCGLTFPVGEKYLTLVLGGWDGNVVGLSCLDGISFRFGFDGQGAVEDDGVLVEVRALARLEEAAASGARVACLQELFRRPYPCQSEDPTRFEWAEPIPGPSTEALAKLAGARGLAIVASLFERRAEVHPT